MLQPRKDVLREQLVLAAAQLIRERELVEIERNLDIEMCELQERCIIALERDLREARRRWWHRWVRK